MNQTYAKKEHIKNFGQLLPGKGKSLIKQISKLEITTIFVKKLQNTIVIYWKKISGIQKQLQLLKQLLADYEKQFSQPAVYQLLNLFFEANLAKKYTICLFYYYYK